MSESSPVVAGDDILISQYNNLRNDVIHTTLGHEHNGTDSKRVVDITGNADKVDGFHAGNETGKVPVSNGTVNTDLNADKVDGFHIKKITGTTANSQGGNVVISHGLTLSKIVAITGIVVDSATQRIPPGFTESGKQWRMAATTDNIIVYNHSSDSGNILSKTVIVIIIYEE